MATIKNGDQGTIYTVGEIIWNERDDLQYYTEVHGLNEGVEDRPRHMIQCMERNNFDFVETLDRSIRFLYKRPSPLDEKALSLLSVRGKLDLLRRLLLERSNEIPVEQRIDYIRRFEDDLHKYVEVEKLRDMVILRHLIQPKRVWLRELVDADDSTVSAWFNLDDSMSSEHEGFVRL
jgi:hypothetical protein